MSSLETTLSNLKNSLKTAIETKFETTCTSTNIKNLIGELNTNIGGDTVSYDYETLSPTQTTPTSVVDKILTVGNYFVAVLGTANITATVTSGFASLISEIDNIEISQTPIEPITPTISISASKQVVKSGSNTTLSVTVTGDDAHGTPTGSVKFYEGTSSTAFQTKSSPSGTTGNSATYTTTVSKTVTATTVYKFSAKYYTKDSSIYNNSAKSNEIGVRWDAT